LFGLIFELPLILLILARLGSSGWSFAPPAAVAILLSRRGRSLSCRRAHHGAIAIPLYGMYELSIVAVRLFGGPIAGPGPARPGAGGYGPGNATGAIIPEAQLD